MHCWRVWGAAGQDHSIIASVSICPWPVTWLLSRESGKPRTVVVVTNPISHPPYVAQQRKKASGARHCSNMQRVDLIPPAPTLQHCELCGCFSHQAAEIYSCWPGNTAAIVGLPEMLFATAAPACAARLPWQTDITCLMTSKESVITARAEGNGKASGFLFSRQP